MSFSLDQSIFGGRKSHEGLHRLYNLGVQSKEIWTHLLLHRDCNKKMSQSRVMT